MAINWQVTDSTQYPSFVELCVRFSHDDGSPITDFVTGETADYLERRVQTDGSIPDLEVKIEVVAACFTPSKIDVATDIGTTGTVTVSADAGVAPSAKVDTPVRKDSPPTKGQVTDVVGAVSTF